MDEYITRPVILEEKVTKHDRYYVLYAIEGEPMQVMACRTYERANKVMRHYERSGQIDVYNPVLDSTEPIEPAFAVRVQSVEQLKCEWRNIKIKGD